MSREEYARTMNPDFKVVYTYDEEPFVYRDPWNEKVSVTLQAVSRGTEISRAHGYMVRRSTLNKIIDALEYDAESREEEIELCPLCGSSCHAEKFSNGKWYVECNYCGTSTAPLFDTKDDAVKFWNDREVG